MMNNEADTSTSSDKPLPTMKTVFVVSKPSQDEKDAYDFVSDPRLQ